jgi:hypothetical protein
MCCFEGNLIKYWYQTTYWSRRFKELVIISILNMSKVITRAFRRQLKMVAPQQPLPEIILPHEQPHSQV